MSGTVQPRPPGDKLKIFDSIQDSGQREHFATGSQRDTQEGKGRFDLLPVIPLVRLARHYEHGAQKYDDHNWRKGQPLSRYFSSCMRHLLKWVAGCKDEDHLAAAAWNIFALIETEWRIERGLMSADLDDRYAPMTLGEDLFK